MMNYGSHAFFVLLESTQREVEAYVQMDKIKSVQAQQATLLSA